MKSNLLLAALLVLATATPLYAQQPPLRDANGEYSYDPADGYASPVNSLDLLGSSTNVVIKEVSYGVLPDFLMKQADNIARECVNNAGDTKLIKYYRYMSDTGRDKGRHPNYLFDLYGLKDRDQKSCILGRACADNECFLIGYAPTGGNSWGQAFLVRQRGWTRKEIASPEANANPKDKLMILSLASQAFCPPIANDGTAPANPDTCYADRVWTEAGLSTYPAMGVITQPDLQEAPQMMFEAPPSPGMEQQPAYDPAAAPITTEPAPTP